MQTAKAVCFVYMKWYFCKNSVYYGGGSSSYSAYNAIVGPIYYNGKYYGTPENRVYRVTMSGSILDQEWKLYPIDSTGSISYHYNRLVGGTTSYSATAYTDLGEGVFISGKYQFYTTIGQVPYSGISIPLRFNITQENGEVFEGNSILTNYSDRFPTTSQYPNFFNVNTSNNRIGFYSVSDGELSKTNFIVDFGETPQEVPTFIKEWLDSWADKIYFDTWNILSFSGNMQISQLENMPTISKIKLTVLSNQCTMYYTNKEDGKTYDITFEIPSIEYREFIGISLTPNSNTPYVKADGVEHDVDLEGNITLYLSYTKQTRPYTEPIPINLYQNTAEHNRVDKTNYLTQIGTLQGTLREPFSLTGGSIIIQLTSLPTFNYIYIENFERYYYVTEVTVLSNTLYEISLDVDVLMSFKDAILNTKCFVDRNEHDFDENIPDNYRTYESGFDVETVGIENDFLNDGASYILSGLDLDIQEG